jgi:hypothetical protein
MESKTQTQQQQKPGTFAAAEEKKSGDVKSPDVLLYSDLYKNAMMGADSAAKMVGKTGDAQEHDGVVAGAELRQLITDMMEGYAGYAKKAAAALHELHVPATQLSALEKLPAEIGITVQTMFDKSVSKCAEIMINGVTMGIIDMKKAQRVCSENGCSPDAYRLAGDLISFCERYVERLKEFL